MHRGNLSCLRLGVVVGALSALGAPANAQQSLARFGLAAGATLPVGDYGADKNVGYHLGVVLHVGLPAVPIGFRIDGVFNEMKYSGSATKEQLWMADANVVVRVPNLARVTPYVIGGAGVYNRRRTPSLGSASSTRLGVNVGGGVRFGVGDAHTFVEARYHAAGGGDNLRILPISFGVSF